MALLLFVQPQQPQLLAYDMNNNNNNTATNCSSSTSFWGGIPVAWAAFTRRRHLPTKDIESEKQPIPKNNNKNVTTPMTLNQILAKAGKKGLGGGIPGFLAGIIQVLSLMWLRTITNYQCRYGTSFRDAYVTLMKDGGVARLYRGLWFALVQAPLSRFVSTASNDGIEALMSSLTATKNWGPGRTTVIASLVVGLWRIALMPIDTCKTVLQVDSIDGFRNLMRRVKAGKIGVLYQGSLALAFSAIIGHYPWFYTYNLLSKSALVNSLITSTLLRNAGIGVTASIVSDTVVNSIRVVKTMKQTMGSKHEHVGYVETIRMILAVDGWKGLFGRGLQTRIIANALQSLVFTVIWRALADYWRRKAEGRHLSEAEES